MARLNSGWRNPSSTQLSCDIMVVFFPTLVMKMSTSLWSRSLPGPAGTKESGNNEKKDLEEDLAWDNGDPGSIAIALGHFRARSRSRLLY